MEASCVGTETDTSHSQKQQKDISAAVAVAGNTPHSHEVLGGRAQLQRVPTWELSQGLASALTPNPSSLLLGYISPRTTKQNTGQGP